MTDKKLSETTDHELILEYVEQLKEDNKRLKGELESNKQPRYIFDGKAFEKATDHWTWATLVIAGVLIGVIHLIVYIWPSTYETGRFYIQHSSHNYGKAPPCECPPTPKEFDDCYKVIKEIENGSDESMTSCMRNREDAYKVANELSDEWHNLKNKGRSSERD